MQFAPKDDTIDQEIERQQQQVAAARLLKWDVRFLQLAALVASWSRDPSTKVGAVIARPDNTIASLGFNGFPRGILDTEERYTDRDQKLARTVHAETNAILNAKERLNGMTLYCTLFPCSTCALNVVQAGIIRVLTLLPTEEQAKRWGDSFRLTESLFNEAGVQFSYLDINP